MKNAKIGESFFERYGCSSLGKVAATPPPPPLALRHTELFYCKSRSFWWFFLFSVTVHTRYT